MIAECFFGALIAVVLPLEEFYVAPRTRDKFSDCECAHLELCQWYIPVHNLEEEFELLRHHIRTHNGDKQILKELDLLEQILPDQPREYLRPRGLQWHTRIERASKCKRLCKHHSKCHVVRDIPQTINEGPPHDGLAWTWDVTENCYRSDTTAVYPQQVANPAFDEIAYREKADKPPKQTAAEALRKKRLEQKKNTISASSSDPYDVTA